jgi:hypothetical protein
MVVHIIDISKSEANYMRKHGYEKYVIRTHTRHIKYFLVEQPDIIDSRGNIERVGALHFLNTYRQAITTHGRF